MEGRTVRLPVSWPGHADESHERRSFDQGDRPVLQNGVKAMRVRAITSFGTWVGAEHERPRRRAGRPAIVREVAGKSNDPQLALRGRPSTIERWLARYAP